MAKTVKKAKQAHTEGSRRKAKPPSAASVPSALAALRDCVTARLARCNHTRASTSATSTDTAASALRHEPVAAVMPTTNTGASAQPTLPEMPCAA